MSFLTPPVAADVVTESRLRPEQVDTEFADAAELVTDTGIRVTKAVQRVETKLLSVITAAAWAAQDADTLARRGAMATEVVALYAQASLYGSAGQLRPAYYQRATEKRDEAKELLQSLLDDIVNNSAQPASATGATSFSTAPYRFDADGVLVDNV